MVFKIFIAMSITWMSDVVSFIAVWRLGKNETFKYIAILDFINSLQGVVIFLVMILKSPIFAKSAGKTLGIRTFSLDHETRCVT